MSVLQSITVFIEVSKGFGKTLLDISPDNLVPLQKVGSRKVADKFPEAHKYRRLTLVNYFTS
jgi:hypothetical protein